MSGVEHTTTFLLNRRFSNERKGQGNEREQEMKRGSQGGEKVPRAYNVVA
jgi:hypothetical protein